MLFIKVHLFLTLQSIYDCCLYLQVRRLRNRKVKYLSQVHTQATWLPFTFPHHPYTMLPPSYTDSQEGTKAPRQPRVGPTPNSIPSAEVLSLVKVTFTVSGISRERTSLGATFQLTKGGHGQSHRNKQSRIPQCSPFVKVKASSAREVGVREADGVGRTTHRFVFGAEGRGSQLTAVVGL